MERRSNEKDVSGEKFPIIGVVAVILLVVANAWFLNKTFTGKAGELPRLRVNPFKASSLVLANPASREAISWESPKNILILGRAGRGNNAPDLTDTIIVAHINPASSQETPSEGTEVIKLVSLPRDLLVEAGNTNRFLKINALWPYTRAHPTQERLETIGATVEKITGLFIDSVIIFDLTTVRKIINEIDGVTVLVTEDIYDPDFPAPGGGYETFTLTKGWRYLNAEDALKFVRTRSGPGGDFTRIAHQQELLRAIKGKIVSLNPVWNFPTLWTIFNTLKNELITDLTFDDARSLWFVGKKVPLDKVETMTIDIPSGLVEPKTVNIGGQSAYVLVARGESFEYSKIKEAVGEFINN